MKRYSYYDEITGCGDVIPSLVAENIASFVSPYLRLDGLSNGSYNLAVDGSLGPVYFQYKPPAGLQYFCTGIAIFMENGASFPHDKFATVAPLVSGVQLDINFDQATLTSEDVVNWKINHEIESFFDMNPIAGATPPPQKFNGFHYFTKSFANGQALLLREGLGGMRAIIRDDLEISGLVFTIRLFGHLRKNFNP